LRRTFVAADPDKPDGELAFGQSSFSGDDGGSHPVVDPDRDKPDGNLGRQEVRYDEPQGEVQKTIKKRDV